MSELIQVLLGDVVCESVEQITPKNDFIYVDISSIDRDKKIILNTKEFSAESAPSRAKQVLKNGDVLVSMTRPNLNAVALVPEFLDGAIGSTGFHVLRSRWIDSSYLFYLVQSDEFVEAMCAVVQGALYPAVRPKDIGAFKFLLPSPQLQTRIVTKLEELLSDLDAGVAELKAAQKKLTQYRQSLLKAAVEGALTAEWRQHNPPQETGAQLLERILTERRARWEAKQLAKFANQGKAPPKGWQSKYPVPVAPDVAGLPQLPQGWVWASVDQLTEFVTSGSRGWAEYYASEGAIFIRSQNINKDKLDISDIAFVNPPKLSEGVRTLVQLDDLLLTITGANVGKAARVDISLPEAYVSQHVALIRPLLNEFSQYLHIYLTAGAGGRGQLNKEAYGAGKPGLNLQQVAAVAVPLLCSHEMALLMAELGVQLEALEAQNLAIESALRQSTAQRQNILRAAFSGQLVPQDPSDEPASRLLERIRSERAAQASVPKVRKARAVKGVA